MKKDFKNNFIFFVLIFFILVVWLILHYLFNIPTYKLPSVKSVINVLYYNFNDVIKDFSITFFESFIGFLLSIIFGVFLAFTFSLSVIMERAVFPLVVALQSVPVVAFAPILFVWLGFSYFTKIILSVLIAVFPIIINVYKGLSIVPEEDLEFFKSLDATKYEIFIHLRIPHAIPHFLNSLKISAPLSSVGAIVSEFTGAKNGLGFKIIISQYRSDIPALFLYTILASILGIILYYIASIPEKFFKKYYYEYEEL